MDFLVQNALDSANELASSQTDDMNIGQANIKVLGCGGAGNNMADWLYRKGIKGAEIISVNTDKLHLDHRESDKKILIGRDTTRGLGAGGNPDIGAQSAREQIHELKSAVQGSDMVFCLRRIGRRNWKRSSSSCSTSCKRKWRNSYWSCYNAFQY